MQNRLRGARFASATAAMMLLATLELGVIPTASGAEAYRAPHTADGRPNLNGIWQAGRLLTRQTGTSRNMRRDRDR
jgi:hypothetical protein